MQPAVPPQRETEAHAMITRDQMRTADRIIVNVLQKVWTDPLQVSCRSCLRCSTVKVHCIHESCPASCLHGLAGEGTKCIYLHL